MTKSFMTINTNLNGMKNRIQNLQFDITTELGTIMWANDGCDASQELDVDGDKYGDTYQKFNERRAGAVTELHAKIKNMREVMLSLENALKDSYDYS